MRLSVFFLLLPSICFAQQTIDAEQFFATGLAGFEQMEKPAGEKVHFPWIEKYDVRTETRDFDAGKQEYTFRLSPVTPGMRKAQKSLYEEMRNAPDVDGMEIRCDRALTLHEDWLTLFMLRESERAMNEWAVVLKDKQTILEKMVGTLDFDPEKLVKLQTERSDLNFALDRLRLEREYLLEKYGLRDGEIDFGNFATVETVFEYLESNSNLTAGPGLDGLEMEHKKQLVLREMAVESSEKKQVLDFVQFRYNGPHSDPFQERFSVGMGFQLNNSGNQKLKMQELQIEKEALTLKAERDSRKRQEQLNTLANELRRDVRAFLQFQNTLDAEREQLQSLGSAISRKEGTSPLFLLDIEERHISMKMKALDKQESLLRDYLEYLHLSEDMCGTDVVNHLGQ